jgi:hypothetical protein
MWDVQDCKKLCFCLTELLPLVQEDPTCYWHHMISTGICYLLLKVGLPFCGKDWCQVKVVLRFM